MNTFPHRFQLVKWVLFSGIAALFTGSLLINARAADQPAMPMGGGMAQPAMPAGTGGAMDMGAPYEVPASLPTPSVTIAVTPDKEGGWNLHIMVKNFTFSGQHVGTANVPGEGHGHILIDGKMVGRAYGEWVYLSAADVPAGAHMLTLRLETNDHRDYLVGGKQVEASAPLAPMGM